MELSFFDHSPLGMPGPAVLTPCGPAPPSQIAPSMLVPPYPSFNSQPTLVMWDEDVREEIKCYHCSLVFHWTSEALAHWSSARHLQMVDFLNGEPMVYCVVCNWLPDMPNQHLGGSRHMKNLRRLGRIANHADMQLRQVRLFADGRRYAKLINPYE